MGMKEMMGMKGMKVLRAVLVALSIPLQPLWVHGRFSGFRWTPELDPLSRGRG